MKSKKRTSQIWKSLGLPEEYHIKLQQLARNNHRTISGHMAALIDADLLSRTNQLNAVKKITPTEA